MPKPTYADLQRKVQELQRLVNVKIFPQEFYFEARDLIYFKGYKDWSIDFFDRKIEDLTGYNFEDFSDKKIKWIDIIYDNDLHIAKNAIRQALSTDRYYFAEYRIVKKQGDLVWIKVRGYITFDSHKQFQSLRGVLNDITLEKYGKAPFDSWSANISWANNMEDGIYIISKDFRVLFMNQALIDMIGDQTGKVCYQALFQRDAPCPWSVMNQIDRENACFIQEYHLRVADTEKVFEVRSIPIRLHDGTSAKLGHLREITETRKLELEVKELAARRRAIEDGANRADLGVFILQDSQSKEARFRFTNEAFSRATGYDADELLSKSLPELVHPDNLPAIMERLRLTQRGEILDQGIEIKLVRKDGVPIIGRFSFALSSHEGRVATIGFFRDITKKKMSERALWRSQRLASIGRLAAEIAHEINNPLTSVITFSKLLTAIMQQVPFPAHRINELRTYLGYLQSETERCANISRNLLDFSRQTKIDVRENNINVILEKTLNILKHRASLDKIEICTHYASSIPPVSCDFSRLQQAFINILWNAIEAMPHGGVLTVTTDIDPQQEMIEVHIIDTGTGIPEENLERIFEPFFTTKDEGKGVGLGLSVAYGLIRQHHGEIQIQSRVGEGTHATIQFPAGPRALSIEEQSDEYLFGIKGIPGWENNAPRGKGRLEAENHKE